MVPATNVAAVAVDGLRGGFFDAGSVAALLLALSLASTSVSRSRIIRSSFQSSSPNSRLRMSRSS